MEERCRSPNELGFAPDDGTDAEAARGDDWAGESGESGESCDEGEEGMRDAERSP